MKLPPWWLALVTICAFPQQSASCQEHPRACRSVHLGFKAAEGTAFYNEITVRDTAPGSYFMACGFSKGYFGIQELGGGKKVVLFSVWEPGQQNNPHLTPAERRVKNIAVGPRVRVKRFGGEGTGGQSFFDYAWEVGKTYRFVVYARPDGDRTQYAGYFYVPEENRWQHMATFSTLAAGHLVRGYYSFLEDFRRDGDSATRIRRCHFGNGWALIGDEWHALTRARFTADATPTTNVDAGVEYGRFFLATGGAVSNANVPLWDTFGLPEVESKPPLDLPQPFGDGAPEKARLRILSYNIKHGRGNDGQVDLKRTASVIRRLNPDVVALQEVDSSVDRSGQVNQIETLARLTGLTHHAFGAFFDFQGGKYGMATLSRYPIDNRNNLRLPDGAEPRTSLITTITSHANDTLTIANVHFYRTEPERLAQARTLLEHLVADKQKNVVVAGDFNSTPDSPVMKLFDSGWNNPHKDEDCWTFPSDQPRTEIDFAMTRLGSQWSIDSIDVIREPVVSDHRPLVLELREAE